MKLLSYWPNQEQINECIRKEAETLSEAAFLAVHQPMQFLRCSTLDHKQELQCSENDLLEAFLSENLPSGTLLLPIVGSSGVGKSHMIRWLDAQIRRIKDGKERHIIRVPKSASLKTVLHLILEDLRGKEYDNIRNLLKKARDQISALTTLHNLRANILVELEKVSNLASQQIQELRKQRKEIGIEYKAQKDHSGKRGLQALLSDPILGEHFMRGSLSQIANRVISGLSEDIDPKTQFVEEDLVLNENINLSEASVPARDYYNFINRADGKERKYAVELLNKVIDSAIHQILDLGETRLYDLFILIREQLFHEGKELILLVEDFAALAGIQGALLDVMIKEAIRDGKQILCTMRTSLAITAGYLSNWETVSTRAEFEWIIEDVPSEKDEQILDRIIDFVGAYINASRFGQKYLKNSYSSSANDDLTSWVPTFGSDHSYEQNDLKILEAFGYSSQEYSLFPFNKNAIQQLAYIHLINADNNLTFNPRSIIKLILWETLANYREWFERDLFPPENFHNFDPSHVAIDIRNKIVQIFPDQSTQNRYLALVNFWGNNPSTFGDIARIPNEIFIAFSMEPILDSGQYTPSEKKELERTRDETESKGDMPKHKDEISEWEKKLQEWASGKELLQIDANHLRGIITEDIISTIDWDIELLKPIKMVEISYYRQRVYLPRARGQKVDIKNSMAAICSEEDLNNTQKSFNIIQDLRAAIRYHFYKSWDYKGGEEDSARYGHLLEKLSRQAVAYFKKRYYRAEMDFVPILTQILLLGARVLALNESNKDDDKSLIFSMLSKSNQETMFTNESAAGSEEWKIIKSKCCDVRPKALQMLLLQVSARQGGADKIHAIDAMRILEGINEFKQSWKFDGQFPTNIVDEYKAVIDHIKYLQRHLARATEEKKEMVKHFQDQLICWLGNKPNQNLLIADMKGLINKSKELGIFQSELPLNDLVECIERFEQCNLESIVSQVNEVVEAKKFGRILTVLAGLEESGMQHITFLLKAYDDFLRQTRKNVDAKKKSLGGNLLDDYIREIRSELGFIEATIQGIKGKENC